MSSKITYTKAERVCVTLTGQDIKRAITAYLANYLNVQTNAEWSWDVHDSDVGDVFGVTIAWTEPAETIVDEVE